MLSKIVLFVLVLSVSLANLRYAAPRSFIRPILRIYDGYEDTEGKYPYVVALVYRSFARICSGTLIAPEWVLTAGHCLITMLNEIQYGNMTVPPDMSNTKSKILKIVPHPAFRDYIEYGGNLENDIALLRVQAVRMRVYGKISALDFRSLTGQAVQFAGYGMTYTDETKNRLSVDKQDQMRPLQLGDGVIIRCDFQELDIYMCVVPKCSTIEQTSLQGDSGGPLLYDGKVVGVLMGGISYSKIPNSLYTPISRYLSWINNVLASETNEN